MKQTKLKVNMFSAIYKQNDWHVGCVQLPTSEEEQSIRKILNEIKEHIKFDTEKNKVIGYQAKIGKGELGGVIKIVPKSYGIEMCMKVLDKELE